LACLKVLKIPNSSKDGEIEFVKIFLENDG